MGYPTGVTTFPARSAGQKVGSAHINALQDEVTAIENALLNGVAHNLAITGTLSATGAITATGGQIVFPATQVPSTNANTLDDYEETQWTPTDASGAGLTITNNGCSAIKKGQDVTVYFYITYPATADGTNALVGGLPWTAGLAGTVGYGGCVIPWTDSGTAISAMVTSAATTLEFYGVPGTTRRTNAQMSTISIRGSFSYRASA
jgi:hypothetical protein